MEDKLAVLRSKALKLPAHPGVYIMHDKNNNIIYIGKAKALCNRVSQYFGSQSGHSPKVRRMVENVDHFEYVLCDSEYEALVLECSLIKLHKPKYNILLKDEKGYHYIKITKEEYPKITASKRIDDDGAQYIGPYVSSYAVKQAVDSACSAFMLATCKRDFSKERTKARPCLNYHIKRCMAPCRGNISPELYQYAVNDAIAFLKSGKGDIIKELTARMKKASDDLDFETAAVLRDRITAIKKMGEHQKVIMAKIEEQDVIALASRNNDICFQVFRFSEGKLFDRESFLLFDTANDEQTRYEFIRQYYSIRDRIPPRITVDGNIADSELLEHWLSEQAGRKVSFHIPQKGEQLRLIEMCQKNALEELSQLRGITGINAAKCEALGNALGIPTPEYIEAYDISNTAGNENVAGMVVFENGKPLKSAYRHFRIKTFSGQDDYASMCEIISRRLDEYEKSQSNESGFGRLPDLILLDGGKGHVASVEPLMRNRGYSIPVFGMVKDGRHRTRAIATDGGEIDISRDRTAFSFVGTIQEEVHRFAIAFHRKQRAKKTLHLTLTEIDSIGPKRAAALLKKFKSINNIRNASVDELASVDGMTVKAAENIKKHFNSNT